MMSDMDEEPCRLAGDQIWFRFLYAYIVGEPEGGTGT